MIQCRVKVNRGTGCTVFEPPMITVSQSCYHRSNKIAFESSKNSGFYGFEKGLLFLGDRW